MIALIFGKTKCMCDYGNEKRKQCMRGFKYKWMKQSLIHGNESIIIIVNIIITTSPHSHYYY